jgi:hypothetical protein
MPHYCRICERSRANEKFTGRGHRNRICKDCQRLPRDEIDRIDRMDELYGFLVNYLSDCEKPKDPRWQERNQNRDGIALSYFKKIWGQP